MYLKQLVRMKVIRILHVVLIIETALFGPVNMCQLFEFWYAMLHTSLMSHLLLEIYPSLCLLDPGLSSQYLPVLPLHVQPAFEVSAGQ